MTTLMLIVSLAVFFLIMGLGLWFLLLCAKVEDKFYEKREAKIYIWISAFFFLLAVNGDAVDDGSSEFYKFIILWGAFISLLYRRYSLFKDRHQIK